MPYQRGSLRQVQRRDGLTWLLRYRKAKADGRRVEAIHTVGLVKHFPTEAAARREVDRLGLLIQINEEAPTELTLQQLAEHYLKAEFGEGAIWPKADTTKMCVTHYIRDYIVPKWGACLADSIKPLDVQCWLKSLVDEGRLAWPSVSKLRGIFCRMYRVGIVHELVKRNPIEHLKTREKSDYQAIILQPEQTLKILYAMVNPLHRALVLTCAATALRASEALALRWSDLRWDEGRIRISKRWALGAEGKPKTEASDDYVPMHSVLAQHLAEWRTLSPYHAESDFVFPSLRCGGGVPLSASIFVADYLRPAAKAAGIEIADGQRFGLHNLRHSLSNWLVNTAKVEPKTVQGLLRHSKIQTTLDLYTQTDRDETQAAQGRFLEALKLGSETLQ